MRRSGRTVPLAAVAVLLGLILGVPVTALVRVAAEGGLTGLQRAVGGPFPRAAITHTLLIAAVVTPVAVALGAALALAVERRAAPQRRTARILIVGPLLIPEFVVGFALTEAYGPTGLADRFAGITMPGIFGPVGIVCALIMHALPVAYLAVAAGLAIGVDRNLDRAARAAGATTWTVLRTITLPLLRVPLTAAAALVFVSTVSSFAIPQVLGTPAGFATMSTLVYSDLVLSADPQAFSDLTVVALAMMILVAVALGPLDLWLGRVAPDGRRRPFGAGPGTRARTRGDRFVDAGVWAYSGLAVGVPMLAVLLTALTRGPGLAPVPRNWTVANFAAAFTGGTGAALGRTVWLAAAAAVLAPVLGGMVAGLSRTGWRRPLTLLVTLAYAIPGSALAVGVMIGYGRWLGGSAVLILGAYLAKFWAFGHRPIQAAVDRISPDLTAAARSAGAAPWTALRTVVVPPLGPALWTAVGLVFLLASHELTMSTILYGPGSETFAVVVLNQRDLGGTGTTAALAIVLVVPVLLAAAVLAMLRTGRRRRLGRRRLGRRAARSELLPVPARGPV